jgi:hypothetical protein
MIQKYITDLSTQMGIALSQVSVVAGHSIGCLGVDLVYLRSESDQVSVLVYRTDYDSLLNGVVSDRLEKRILTALEKLRVSVPVLS